MKACPARFFITKNGKTLQNEDILVRSSIISVGGIIGRFIGVHHLV